MAMEKVLDYHIRASTLIHDPIHHTRHVYQSGKSTETAVLHFVDRVERALENKQIALDVEGAFDNTYSHN